MAGKTTTNGTSMISSVLPQIVEKAASLLLDRALYQYDIMVNIQRDIRSLKTKLNEVNEILQEAEERQIDNINVRELLRELVDVCYEARDVLDDFMTAASINTNRNITAASIDARRTSRWVMFDCLPFSFFSRCFNDLQEELPFVSRQQLASRIRNVMGKLDLIMKRSNIVDIQESLRKGGSNSESASRRPETISYVNRQRNLFVGREYEKEEIIKKLVNHHGNDVLVVPIWGVGGIGKTTLAQFIYNDERVKEEDYPICNRQWLFVGEKKFNAKEIIARIIDKSDTQSKVDIYGKLVENFKGNKFLIVLDDVWDLDGNQWNLLFDPLTNVGKGGVIIITTRIREVISTTSTQVPTDLRPLSPEGCWKIFESHAFVDGKSSNRPELEPIGREIVEKLNGHPLATRVAGSLLLNEPDSTWSNFINNWERNLRNNDNAIMTALRWSYKLLPPHLKYCFAYCALFPKDHVFDVKVLVEMWMAHDLIQINGDGRPEDIGTQYFKELTYASLFQCVYERYVMHDMIHNLSLHDISNKEFTSAIGSLSTYCSLFPKGHVHDEKILAEMWMAHDLIQINVGERPEDVGAHYFNELVYASLIQYVDKRYVMHDIIRDLALHVSNEDFSSAIGSLSTDQMEKVRHITIPIDNEYSKNLSSCKSKRILTVYTPYNKWDEASTTPLDNDILLEVFRQSKSLRVLVLSNKHISEIPECIVELKHLRYLDVKKTSVKSLPNSLCELHNLQMLAAPLDAVLPRDIVNIRSLRYLRANAPTCRGIEKLTSLQELSSIHVCEGDNISELGVMRQLRGKLKVKGLENICSSQEAAQALMKDKSNLEELELEFSRDLGKSSIVTDVLDALGCPPNLKCLKIAGYTGVEPPSWMADGKLFTKLQALELSKCCQFEFLQLLGEMRSLEVLRISDCSKIKLLDFSCLPLLRLLVVSCCDELVSISALVAVKNLHIINCEKLESVSINFRGLDSIELLSIHDCPLLESINEEERSTSPSSSSSPWSRLRSLHTDNEQVFRNIFNSNITNIWITRNSMLLKCLGEITKNSSHKLKSLRNLIISDYNELQSLPTGCLPDSLDMLQLYSCPKLQLSADDLLPSLSYLIIKGCPLLYERYNDESGPDRHKINHIPRKEICLLR